MAQQDGNPGARRPDEHEFRAYVERALTDLGAVLQEVRTELMADLSGLGVDIDELATAIPALASNISTLTDELTQKEADLQAEIAKEGQDQEAIAKLEGELAQVQALKERLDPVAAEASKIAGTGSPAGGEAGGEEPPLQPPADGGAAPAGTGDGSAGTGEGGV